MHKKYFSCGLNDNNQLTHGISDGTFHEMRIPQNIKVKEIKCGCGVILIKTNENYLYAFGANFVGQCGVGTKGGVKSWTRCILINSSKVYKKKKKKNMYKNSNEFVTNVNDFSCGVLNSLIITDNYHNIYYTGHKINDNESDKYLFTNINNLVPLHNGLFSNYKKYTRVLTGRSSFIVVIDDEIINYITLGDYCVKKNYENQKFYGYKIKEIQITENGFIFTTQSNLLYSYKTCLDKETQELTSVYFIHPHNRLVACHLGSGVVYRYGNYKYYKDRGMYYKYPLGNYKVKRNMEFHCNDLVQPLPYNISNEGNEKKRFKIIF
ncbi:hypothetical protein ABK040_003392 [Willaertia magna]